MCLALFRSTYLPQIANDPANELHLCGSWEVIVGELDTFGKVYSETGRRPFFFLRESTVLNSTCSAYLGVQGVSWPQTYHDAFGERSCKPIGSVPLKKRRALTHLFVTGAYRVHEATPPFVGYA